MADGKQTPKVDPIRDNPQLNQTTRDYMRLIEEQNKSRVADLLRARKRNNITGAILGCLVLGIYTYTISAVKQEKFLDDFEEPKLVEKN